MLDSIQILVRIYIRIIWLICRIWFEIKIWLCPQAIWFKFNLIYIIHIDIFLIYLPKTKSYTSEMFLVSLIYTRYFPTSNYICILVLPAFFKIKLSLQNFLNWIFIFNIYTYSSSNDCLKLNLFWRRISIFFEKL